MIDKFKSKGGAAPAKDGEPKIDTTVTDKQRNDFIQGDIFYGWVFHDNHVPRSTRTMKAYADAVIVEQRKRTAKKSPVEKLVSAVGIQAIKASEGKGLLGTLNKGYNQARQTANYINQQRKRTFGDAGQRMSALRSRSSGTASKSLSAPPSAAPPRKQGATGTPGATGPPENVGKVCYQDIKEFEGKEGCSDNKSSFCRFETKEENENDAKGTCAAPDCKVYTGEVNQCGTMHVCVPANGSPPDFKRYKGKQQKLKSSFFSSSDKFEQSQIDDLFSKMEKAFKEAETLEAEFFDKGLFNINNRYSEHYFRIKYNYIRPNRKTVQKSDTAQNLIVNEFKYNNEEYEDHKKYRSMGFKLLALPTIETLEKANIKEMVEKIWNFTLSLTEVYNTINELYKSKANKTKMKFDKEKIKAYRTKRASTTEGQKTKDEKKKFGDLIKKKETRADYVFKEGEYDLKDLQYWAKKLSKNILGRSACPGLLRLILYYIALNTNKELSKLKKESLKNNKEGKTGNDDSGANEKAIKQLKGDIQKIKEDFLKGKVKNSGDSGVPIISFDNKLKELDKLIEKKELSKYKTELERLQGIIDSIIIIDNPANNEKELESQKKKLEEAINELKDKLFKGKKDADFLIYIDMYHHFLEVINDFMNVSLNADGKQKGGAKSQDESGSEEEDEDDDDESVKEDDKQPKFSDIKGDDVKTQLQKFLDYCQNEDLVNLAKIYFGETEDNKLLKLFEFKKEVGTKKDDGDEKLYPNPKNIENKDEIYEIIRNIEDSLQNLINKSDNQRIEKIRARIETKKEEISDIKKALDDKKTEILGKIDELKDNDKFYLLRQIYKDYFEILDEYFTEDKFNQDKYKLFYNQLISFQYTLFLGVFHLSSDENTITLAALFRQYLTLLESNLKNFSKDKYLKIEEYENFGLRAEAQNYEFYFKNKFFKKTDEEEMKKEEKGYKNMDKQIKEMEKIYKESEHYEKGIKKLQEKFLIQDENFFKNFKEYLEKEYNLKNMPEKNELTQYLEDRRFISKVISKIKIVNEKGKYGAFRELEEDRANERSIDYRYAHLFDMYFKRFLIASHGRGFSQQAHSTSNSKYKGSQPYLYARFMISKYLFNKKQNNFYDYRKKMLKKSNFVNVFKIKTKEYNAARGNKKSTGFDRSAATSVKNTGGSYNKPFINQRGGEDDDDEGKCIPLKYGCKQWPGKAPPFMSMVPSMKTSAEEQKKEAEEKKKQEEKEDKFKKDAEKAFIGKSDNEEHTKIFREIMDKLTENLESEANIEKLFNENQSGVNNKETQRQKFTDMVYAVYDDEAKPEGSVIDIDLGDIYEKMSSPAESLVSEIMDAASYVQANAVETQGGGKKTKKKYKIKRNKKFSNKRKRYIFLKGGSSKDEKKQITPKVKELYDILINILEYYNNNNENKLDESLFSNIKDINKQNLADSMKKFIDGHEFKKSTANITTASNSSTEQKTEVHWVEKQEIYGIIDILYFLIGSNDTIMNKEDIFEYISTFLNNMKGKLTSKGGGKIENFRGGSSPDEGDKLSDKIQDFLNSINNVDNSEPERKLKNEEKVKEVLHNEIIDILFAKIKAKEEGGESKQNKKGDDEGKECKKYELSENTDQAYRSTLAPSSATLPDFIMMRMYFTCVSSNERGYFAIQGQDNGYHRFAMRKYIKRKKTLVIQQIDSPNKVEVIKIKTGGDTLIGGVSKEIYDSLGGKESGERQNDGKSVVRFSIEPEKKPKENDFGGFTNKLYLEFTKKQKESAGKQDGSEGSSNSTSQPGNEGESKEVALADNPLYNIEAFVDADGNVTAVGYLQGAFAYGDSKDSKGVTKIFVTEEDGAADQPNVLGNAIILDELKQKSIAENCLYSFELNTVNTGNRGEYEFRWTKIIIWNRRSTNSKRTT